jgi:hypothetical protein
MRTPMLSTVTAVSAMTGTIGSAFLISFICFPFLWLVRSLEVKRKRRRSRQHWAADTGVVRERREITRCRR